MKNKTYILGIITTILVFLGIFFKMQHWPGAGYLLIIGIFLLVCIFLPVALWNNFKSEAGVKSKTLGIITWLTCFFVFTAMLFKIQHWPGAGYMLLLAIPFPFAIFLPVFLVVTGKNKNYNVFNTIAVLLLLTVISAFTALLAINVSLERTVDSLMLSRNYNNAEAALQKIPEANPLNPMSVKIDEALKLLDEYQGLVFQNEGISPEEWLKDPEVIIERSRNAAKSYVIEEREGKVRQELQQVLSGMIITSKSDPALASLSKTLPAVLLMEEQSKDHYIWSDGLFKSDIMPWVHNYLDGLRVNLIMIKETL